MASASPNHSTKKRCLSTCSGSGGCGGTNASVTCACCKRVLVKEEGVPRVLTGPAKKIKLEFDSEISVKKEPEEPSSSTMSTTLKDQPIEQKKRGGDEIIFKEESADDGSTSDKDSTISQTSSASSFSVPKPKASFGNFKRPFKNNYSRGYKRPYYHKNNNYRNNSYNNAYAGNNYQNNGFNYGFHRGFSNRAPNVMQQIFYNQPPNVASIPLRPPLAIEQPFSPFNANFRTPPCSPIPFNSQFNRPPIQHPPFSSNGRGNVMNSVIPDPPRGSTPTSHVGQTAQSWWKALEWPNKSSGSLPTNPPNNEKVKLDVSTLSVSESEIPLFSETDETKTKTYIGKDNGLSIQKATGKNEGSTPAKNSSTSVKASTDFPDTEEDDQALADNDVDDKDWIEELAVQAVIPVKALCSSCLHSSEPKKECSDPANSDVEILFNSCDIQICSEEGSGISRKGPRRPSIFNKTVEVVDVNDFNDDDDDAEDMIQDIHSTSAKRKLFDYARNCDALSSKTQRDNDDVDIIEDEGQGRRLNEKDSISVDDSEHILDVLDVGEDIVLNAACSTGIEVPGSSNPTRLDEPVEDGLEQPSGDVEDQNVADEPVGVVKLVADHEEVELKSMEDVKDIITDIREVGEELVLFSESMATDLVQCESRVERAAAVSYGAMDEVPCDLREIGDEVEESVYINVHKDTKASIEPKELSKQNQVVREDSAEGGNCHWSETSAITGDQSITPRECTEEVQWVGGDDAAMGVPIDIVGSPIVCTLSDNGDNVTSVVQEVCDKSTDFSSSAINRKLTTAKESDIEQPKTPRKLIRSSASSTPVRLTRSLCKSSVRREGNIDTTDPIIVDDGVQLVEASFPSSHKPMSSLAGVLLEKSRSTPQRRSSRLTKIDTNVVCVDATVTTVEDEETQGDQIQIVSISHESTTSRSKQTLRKRARDLQCISEAPEIVSEKVTRHNTATTPGVGVPWIQKSNRITVEQQSKALGSGKVTTPSKQQSEGPPSGIVMTRRSIAVASSRCDQLMGSTKAASSNDSDGGNELGSDYDLDYEEDLQETEVKGKMENEVEESGKDVLLVDDDDEDITCLD